MSLIEAIILGLVQGLTEFIPVSSSGHLVLAHELFGVSENGLLFDVALHFGTLLALLAFFNKDLISLARDFFKKGPNTKLARLLAAATIPAVIAGVLLQDLAESAFRSGRLVVVTLAVFALLMLLAERYSSRLEAKARLDKTSTLQALGMGVAQALALVPGVSRSGSTITAGLFLGMDRVAATRFSFLLAIPITIGAIVKVFVFDDALSQAGDDRTVFIAGVASAFLSGIFAIRFLLRYLSKHSLNIFAYYRIVLAVVMLLILSV